MVLCVCMRVHVCIQVVRSAKLCASATGHTAACLPMEVLLSMQKNIL